MVLSRIHHISTEDLQNIQIDVPPPGEQEEPPEIQIQ
jgi:hypothetical protein